MNNVLSLQAEYLSHLIKLEKPVTIYFKNGCKIMGVIAGMNDEVIYFKHGITEYFYQNSIHSIVPVIQYTAET